jgi:hypothetical protein
MTAESVPAAPAPNGGFLPDPCPHGHAGRDVLHCRPCVDAAKAAYEASPAVQRAREVKRQDRRKATAEGALDWKLGKEQAEKDEAALRVFRVIPGDTVKPRRTDWAWRPYGDYGMPIGELVVLIGKGGAAKSTILAWFAARITTGTLDGAWKGKPGNVLILYREDHSEKTITPRLMAAGADRSRIKYLEVEFLGEVDPGGVSLPKDCDALAQFIRDNDIVAVVYDPLSSHLDVKDSNAQQTMRKVYERIRKMHEVTDTLGIGLGHTRKAVAGSLLEAFMGSSEQSNVVRCAWGVIENPQAENEFIMSQEKNNLDIRAGSLTYCVKTEHVSDEWGAKIRTSRIEFTGQTTDTVSDILADQMKPGGGITKKEEAKQWLQGFLADGAKKVDEIREAGEAEGHNLRTLRRAAGNLGVEYEKHGRPGSSDQHNTWALPESREDT